MFIYILISPDGADLSNHDLPTNCTIRRANGAVTIESEISGGISNIVANNIVCLGTRIGVRIKSGHGKGGYIEKAPYNNLTMEDVGQDKNQKLSLNKRMNKKVNFY